MDQQRWKNIESIVDKALTLSDQQKQEKFIKKACEPDQDLYKQVSALLTAIRESKDANFLDEP
ncbi:hypothetical protein [Fodinibius sp.]|uniref:hypothetical protein n=1 Tax=Fodinibius sp. TaxID=1872440 RepID=UPI002ACD44D4|nr:hypothetical protein [Fodinibius sp.]MDZ7657913.1 hypothetical protein [Fodinibius sp.]